MLDEEARRRFEAAWQAGMPVPIESFLTGQQVSHYLATLEELVHIVSMGERRTEKRHTLASRSFLDGQSAND